MPPGIPRPISRTWRDLPGGHSGEEGPPQHPFRGVVVVSPAILFALHPADERYAALVLAAYLMSGGPELVFGGTRIAPGVLELIRGLPLFGNLRATNRFAMLVNGT